MAKCATSTITGNARFCCDYARWRLLTGRIGRLVRGKICCHVVLIRPFVAVAGAG